MTNRILDLADAGAYLRVELEQLKIERDGADAVSVPLRDVAVLILTHPQLVCTQSVLAGIATAGGVVIACDRAHMPAGMMLPLEQHSTQAERFRAQAAAPLPQKKRLWQAIVRAKIRQQAGLLRRLHNDDFGLTELARSVRSGDPANVEAHAAQRYWPALFADDDFRRRRDVADQNRYLNYGYAVLRAIVARAICAAGLHPSLGVHHHNRYDAFALADDLVEPFRPLVDEVVVACTDRFGPAAEINRELKAALLSPLLGLYRAEGEARSVFDWAARAATGLAAALIGESDRLDLPEDLVREESAGAAE